MLFVLNKIHSFQINFFLKKCHLSICDQKKKKKNAKKMCLHSYCYSNKGDVCFLIWKTTPGGFNFRSYRNEIII